MAKPTKEEMLDLLYDKYQTLLDFLQELNHRLEPADRPDHEGILLNTELEIERTKSAYDLIKEDAQIPFPGDDEVQALASATGELQKIVDNNKRLDVLIAAGVAVVKTWPTARKGGD